MKLIYFISIIMSLFISCNKEFENLNNEDIENDIVTDNRLSFSDEKSLTTFVNELKNSKNLSKIESYIKNGNFIPLRFESNEDIEKYLLINKIESFKKLTKKNYNDDYDLYNRVNDISEEIIADDNFASILNFKGEIEIANNIYKYTDVGLFIVDKKNYNLLDDILLDNKISSEIGFTDYDDILRFCSKYKSGESDINSNIKYFRVGNPNENVKKDFDKKELYLEKLLDTKNQQGSKDNTTDLIYFANHLTPCDVRPGFLGWVFGDNAICYDKYQTRRRVRTKVYNHNYGFGYSFGWNVKHQFRGWTGIWRQENTEEIAAIAPKIQYFYSIPTLNFLQQQMTHYQIKNSAFSDFSNFNYKIKINTNLYSNPYGNSSYWNLELIPQSNYIPVFANDLVIEGFGNSNLVEQAIQAGNNALTSERLNTYFWNAIYNTAKTQIPLISHRYFPGTPNTTFISQHPNLGKLIVQRSEFKRASNTSNYSRVYDFGIGVGITIGVNPVPSGSNASPFSFSAGMPNGLFCQPQDLKISIVGAARSGNNWHGSLLLLD